MSNYLFVYGTLMTGFDNPFAKKLHAQAELVGEGQVRGKLYQITSYPGLLHSLDPADQVFGQVLELQGDTEELFVVLDEYEAANTPNPEEDHYSRELIEVKVGERVLECWSYIYLKPVDENKRIVSGRFTSA